MSQDQTNEPRIVVDSDWKSQAQAEKQKLAEQEAQAEDQGGDAHGLPEPDFRALMSTIATQAIMYLGGISDPKSGGVVVDLEYSKFNIDLLGVLETKTKGNLSETEAKELSQILHELRLRWVEMTRLVAEHAAKGDLKSAKGGVGMGGPAGAAGPVVEP